MRRDDFCARGTLEKEVIAAEGGQGSVILRKGEQVNDHMLSGYRAGINSLQFLYEISGALANLVSDWEAVVGSDGKARISIPQSSFKLIQEAVEFRRAHNDLFVC